MADNLKIETTITHAPEGAHMESAGKITFRDIIEQTNPDYVTGTQVMQTGVGATIGTQADIGTIGVVALKNLSTTPSETISVGKTSSYTIKLLPGEFCVFRSATTELVAQGDNGTPTLQYWIWEA